MRIDIISFTARGHELNKKIAGLFSAEKTTAWGKGRGLVPYGSLKDFARQVFPRTDAVIFIGAAGIAVRAAAPHLRGKGQDPAVIVADEAGQFVIPILSGHIGGANRLAETLAVRLGARPVITTATDVSGVFSPDDWAVRCGCTIPDVREVKAVSAALLRGEQVGFSCDFPVSGPLPEGLVDEGSPAHGMVVSLDPARRDFAHTLHIVPKYVHLGMGCRKGTEPLRLEAFVRETLAAHRVSAHGVKTISSIDLKREEAALLRLSESLDRPFYTYSAEALNGAEGTFEASPFVKSVTGTDNVCMRAARLSGRPGSVLIEKTVGEGMTLAAVLEDWRAVF